MQPRRVFYEAPRHHRKYFSKISSEKSSREFQPSLIVENARDISCDISRFVGSYTSMRNISRAKKFIHLAEAIQPMSYATQKEGGMHWTAYQALSQISAEGAVRNWILREKIKCRRHTLMPTNVTEGFSSWRPGRATWRLSWASSEECPLSYFGTQQWLAETLWPVFDRASGRQPPLETRSK